MAELIGYVIINGIKAKDYEFKATVTDQKEIEIYRKELLKKHNDEKRENNSDYVNDFNLFFKLKKLKSDKLHP